MFRRATSFVPLAARAVSTSAAMQAKAVQPPIQLFGIEGRYAHALFSAASKQEKLEQVQKELSEVKARVAKDSAFRDFLSNPTMSRTAKSEGVQAMMTNKKYCDTTVNFFGALAENNRLQHTEEVIAAFDKLITATKGEVPCVVKSASALSSKNKKAVEKALAGFIDAKQTLKIDYVVEDELLGGLVVEMEDKMIDLSVKNQIAQQLKVLKEAL